MSKKSDNPNLDTPIKEPPPSQILSGEGDSGIDDINNIADIGETAKRRENTEPSLKENKTAKKSFWQRLRDFFKSFFRRFSYNVTAKIALISGIVFTLIGALTIMAFVMVLNGNLGNGLVIRMKILVYTIIPISLIIELITVLMFAKVMLSPIRKIINRTKIITRENIGVLRLDEESPRGEIKELAEVLNTMLDNLQSSFETQDRFVSDASHELRTPIAVLQGYSDMLKRWGKTDPNVLDEGIEAIGKETEHMKNLVNMLLFLSRTNNGATKLNIENFFLNDLLEEIIKDTKLIETSHKISMGKMMAFTIDADREMIKQLIRTLLDNAIKYTPEKGEIKLSCYYDDNFAYIIVQDNGIGIKKEDLPHIFERFYRADKARSRNTGSGLGLSIAKKIADAHKGEILISSEDGSGTIVNLKLPL